MNNASFSSSSLTSHITQQLLQRQQETNTDQVWVAIAGAPGSGKSTISSQLMTHLPNAVVVPMDGFHYYKSHLRSMPDPDLAFARRGAAWTFDALKFVEKLKSTKTMGEGSFPSFDHSVGDPVEDDIRVEKSHEFVIVEGLYLFLSSSPWDEIKQLMDLCIFVHADDEVLKSRLISRHMACFNMTEEEAKARAEQNDLPNAVEIIDNKGRADVIIDNSSQMAM